MFRENLIKIINTSIQHTSSNNDASATTPILEVGGVRICKIVKLYHYNAFILTPIHPHGKKWSLNSSLLFYFRDELAKISRIDQRALMLAVFIVDILLIRKVSN